MNLVILHGQNKINDKVHYPRCAGCDQLRHTDIVCKNCLRAGLHRGEITFAQTLFGAIILWAFVLFRNIKNRSFKLVGNWKLILAGTTMGFSAFCFYLSVKYIPVSLAIVLLMQVSWISNLAEWLVFKKPLSKLQIIASVFVVFGTVLAGNLLNTNDLNFSFTGIALALSSAFLYTLYVLFTSKLGNETPMFEKSALMTTGAAMMILLINFHPLPQAHILTLVC